jgi:hypothetical protein
LHYSWSTEARARQALANVSALLRPGGIFVGTMPDANVIIKRLREGILLSSSYFDWLLCLCWAQLLRSASAAYLKIIVHSYNLLNEETATEPCI